MCDPIGAGWRRASEAEEILEAKEILRRGFLDLIIRAEAHGNFRAVENIHRIAEAAERAIDMGKSHELAAVMEKFVEERCRTIGDRPGA